jgi:hypothetical protein
MFRFLRTGAAQGCCAQADSRHVSTARSAKRIVAIHFTGHADSYSLLLQEAKGEDLLAYAGGLAPLLGNRQQEDRKDKGPASSSRTWPL